MILVDNNQVERGKMYEKIEALLRKHNVSSYKVSKDIGIDISTFSKWKDGTNKPNLESLKKLAKYFNVSIDYFL